MKINHSHESVYSDFNSLFLTCVDVFYILTKMDFKILGTNKGKRSLIHDGYTYRVNCLSKMDFKISGTNKGKQSLSHDGYTYRVNYQWKTGSTTWEMYK